MSNLKIETYHELLSGVLSDLYIQGPPVVKLCSVIASGTSVSPDYGQFQAFAPDKVLGVSTSLSYAIDQDCNVSFLEIADFFGIETGSAQVVEIWDAAETDCYFRFSIVVGDIEGNNDLIRMSVVMAYGIGSNRNIINSLVEVVDNSPAHFPIQYRLTFPDYIIRTDYHKITNLWLGVLEADGSTVYRHRVYASGDDRGITGRGNGWRGAAPLFNENNNKDYLYFAFEWTDSLNAILTVHSVSSDIIASKMYFEILSEFYNNYDGYGFAPIIGGIDPNVFGPQTLLVERKRNGDLDFIPIVVTNTGAGVGASSATGQNRYDTIGSNWNWNIMI